VRCSVSGRQSSSPRGPARPSAASATETHGSPTAPTRPPAAPAVGQPSASISQPPESPKQPRGSTPVGQSSPVVPPPVSPPRLPHQRYQGTFISCILCTKRWRVDNLNRFQHIKIAINCLLSLDAPGLLSEQYNLSYSVVKSSCSPGT